METSKLPASKERLSTQLKSEIPNEIIEEQIKKIPNLVFLALSLVSMAGSLYLTTRRKQVLGNFVGLWAPTLLIFGLYNKLVKVEDEVLSDRAIH